MEKRKYGKCEWCGATTDITNSDRDLCKTCSGYPDKATMIREERKKHPTA